MTNLYAAPPSCVCIGGREYALNTSHRAALRAIAALEDETLADFEKQAVLLALLYPTVPENHSEALRLALRFLACGRETQADSSTDIPLYSFTQDAPLIYAAIQKSHGIDVLADDIHWYRFVALFCDIGEDTFFARLIYLRRQQALGKLTPDEKRACAALGSYLPLRTASAPDAQADEFLRLLQGAEQENEHGTN